MRKRNSSIQKNGEHVGKYNFERLNQQFGDF